ncbi:MAG: hypothetical protein WBW53_02205 [Terriglobales bacterium]
MNSSNKDFESDFDRMKDETKDREIAGLWEIKNELARNQSAGGGRMNWVMTGRKITKTWGSTLANSVETTTGAVTGVCVLTPA